MMKLDADWIVGFTDADGSFSVEPDRCQFVISQDARSKHVLFALKSFFGVGIVHKGGGNMFAYTVSRIDALYSVIVPFFYTHPLRSSKHLIWLKFKQAVEEMYGNKIEQKDKTTASFLFFCSNSDEILSPLCSNTIWSALQPKKNRRKMTITAETMGSAGSPINASWLVGFIDGDGCFTVSINPDGIITQLLLQPGSHPRDLKLCEQIRSFLGCGVVYTHKNGVCIYQLSKRTDLVNHLFPLLYTRGNCHRLRTQKRHIASLFRRIVVAMEQNRHLFVSSSTQSEVFSEGRKQILAWKERMRLVASCGGKQM